MRVHVAPLAVLLVSAVVAASTPPADARADAGPTPADGGAVARRFTLAPEPQPAHEALLADPRTQQALETFIRRNGAALARCDAGAREDDPALEGVVVVRLDTDAAGKVVSPQTVASTVNNRALEACVVDAVRSWRLPRTRAGEAESLHVPLAFPLDEAPLSHALVSPAAVPDGPPDASEGGSGGSLDAGLIRLVVRRNQGQVRWCYEQALERGPGVAGKVTVRWLISAEGTVATSSVAASTANDPQLETCVASRVRRWLFPRPSGGGVVNVSYPFVFRTAGDAGTAP